MQSYLFLTARNCKLVGKVQISVELFLAAADNCFVGEFLSFSSWDFAICDF
jgi:hypothetical protein